MCESDGKLWELQQAVFELDRVQFNAAVPGLF